MVALSSVVKRKRVTYKEHLYATSAAGSVLILTGSSFFQVFFSHMMHFLKFAISYAIYITRKPTCNCTLLNLGVQ